MEGVLKKFKNCLLESLLESKKVKVNGLGTFYLTCECTKGGADKESDFNVNQHLKALHIRFLPDQTEEDNLSSREFIKKADFVNIKSLLSSGNSDEEGDDDEENGGSQSEAPEAPTINGETPFSSTTEVTISGPEGAEIRYTTDGSTPTAESTLYSEPFTLSDTTTVKAIAIMGGVSSQVSTKSFTKGSGGGGSNGGGNDVN